MAALQELRPRGCELTPIEIEALADARSRGDPVVRRRHRSTAPEGRPREGLTWTAIDTLVRYGYLVIFGAVFAEQVGLPFPSEPFLLATGGMAGSGRLSLWVALGLATLASLMGDMVWYWLGRTRGPARAGLALPHVARARLVRAAHPGNLRPLRRQVPGGREVRARAQHDRAAARGGRRAARYALSRVQRARGPVLVRRLPRPRLALQLAARDRGGVPGSARQLDVGARSRRDRRLHRVEVHQQAALPEKDQHRADHAGGAQDQARRRRGR